MIGEGYCNQFVLFCLSVHRFALITLKLGGQIFDGVQTDSSKFGKIRVKIKVKRQFFLFSIGHIQRI